MGGRGGCARGAPGRQDGRAPRVVRAPHQPHAEAAQRVGGIRVHLRLVAAEPVVRRARRLEGEFGGSGAAVFASRAVDPDSTSASMSRRSVLHELLRDRSTHAVPEQRQRHPGRATCAISIIAPDRPRRRPSLRHRNHRVRQAGAVAPCPRWSGAHTSTPSGVQCAREPLVAQRVLGRAVRDDDDRPRAAAARHM